MKKPCGGSLKNAKCSVRVPLTFAMQRFTQLKEPSLYSVTPVAIMGDSGAGYCAPGAPRGSRRCTARRMRCTLHAANVTNSRTEVLSATTRNWIACSRHLRKYWRG